MDSESPPITTEEIREKYSGVKSTLRDKGPQPLHNLDIFLEQNTYLFTLLSVFIALAAYFSQFQELPLDESDRVGLVGGVFVLILIIAVVTLYKILSFATRDGRDVIQYENLGVLGFGMSLLPLFLIIFDVFWAYTEPMSGILATLAVITGTIGALMYLFSLDQLADQLEKRTRFSENSISTALIFLGLFLLSGITQTDLYTADLQGVEPTAGFTAWASLAITTGTAWAFAISLISIAVVVLLLIAGITITTVRKILTALFLSPTIRKILPDWLKNWARPDPERGSN
jgi:hypothetical protein